MPGINALIARRTRPDLVSNAPWIRWLPLIGLVWLVFAVALYWFAGVGPIINTLTNPETDPLAYLNGSGVSFVLIVAVVGILWYVIQAMRNRRRGVQTDLMYQMLPPD
jgi:amino acid transporter